VVGDACPVLAPCTVAQLPSATGLQGARGTVTNALAPLVGFAVVGTGAVIATVYSNGTTWIVEACPPLVTTIANLPAAASYQGARATVTNGQATPTFLGAVSTTGAVVAPVFSNGTSWIYG